MQFIIWFIVGIIIGTLTIIAVKKQKVKEVAHHVCKECGHLFDKERGQVVEVITYEYSFSMEGRHIKKLEYCELHKKPYDFIDTRRSREHYYKEVPAHSVEVDEKGKELKKPL